jgi:hypothetical protein
VTYRDADDVLADIDRDTQRAIQRAADATAFRAGVDQLRGNASTGGVTATVDATGLLLDLQLPRDLAYRDGPSLARSIMTAIRTAHADVSRQVQEAANETFGADSPTAERMRAELEKRQAAMPEGGPDRGSGTLG